MAGIETLQPDAMDSEQSSLTAFGNLELDPETLEARFAELVERLEGMNDSGLKTLVQRKDTAGSDMQSGGYGQ